ncbi:MAG: hypothetical protein Q8L68_02260 [Methylococcales bacterium]|nr:hypothetical protein [Methylococcales bacterium]
MKLTLRFLKILILIFFASFLVACDQKVDLYFHPDETWQVKSDLTFSELEKQAIQLADDEFVEFISNLVGLEFSPSVSISDDVFSSLLDLLSSHYGSLGIDFQWMGGIDRYTFTIKGKSLDQFEQLLPGAISVEKVDEDKYHLNINLTEVNTFAALVYHQEITLHSNNITSHNAPREEKGSATWRNPKEIDAVFEPISQPSLGWLFLLIIVFMVVVLVILIVKTQVAKRGDTDGEAYND